MTAEHGRCIMKTQKLVHPTSFGSPLRIEKTESLSAKAYPIVEILFRYFSPDSIFTKSKVLDIDFRTTMSKAIGPCIRSPIRPKEVRFRLLLTQEI